MKKLNTATPEQKKASNPKSSAWVGANAGSGKTHVLVDRVVRLMLEGVDPATILCITFTKAAAAEMASRVHARLGGWIGLSDGELTRHLHSMGNVDVTAAVLARARKLFTAALETPGGFKIQTIHAFCERILHLFPVEAGMAPGFAVLDERQSKEFLGASRDTILSKAQRDDHSNLAEAFLLISQYAQADQFDGLLEVMLGKRQELKILSDRYQSLENIATVLRESLNLEPGDSIESLTSEIASLDHATVQRAITVLLGSDEKKDVASVLSLQEFLRMYPHDDAIRHLESLFLTSTRDALKKPASLYSAAIKKSDSWLATWFADEVERVTLLFEKRDNLKRVDATIALLTLTYAITTHFEFTKRIHGAYDFEDLILRTRDLLTDRRAAQWVLYKLDRGFEHVLIDEAQDTSLAQWQIVDALTEEFFSGSGARETAIRTLFVVGDRKQSIYSFQGADPAAFDTSRSKFREQIQNVEQPFEDVDLTISYRTTEQILKVVDTVFAAGAPAHVGLDGAAQMDLVHQSERRGEPGLFEIWPLVEPVEKEDAQPWQAPVDREPASSPRRVLARRVAKEIGSWIGKRHIAAQNKLVQPGDILILFRTRNTLFSAMISELRKLGIPVAGADRLKLSNNIAILDMMALVRFVLLPSDDYSLACILKSPLVPVPLTEDQLIALAYGREKNSLWARLLQSGDPACVAAHTLLAEWLSISQNIRPYEFFSTVLLKTRPAFLARLGSEAGDALDELLESSLAFEDEHSTSLSGFANWFLANDAEVKRDMDKAHGEVRLMTVHGAKGLESNIVIMPDTTGLPYEGKSGSLMFLETDESDVKLPLWKLSKLVASEKLQRRKTDRTETGLEEYRRQLYVAMTRARDELYVCGCVGETKLSPNSWYHMISETLKMPLKGEPFLRQAVLPDGTEISRYGPDPLFSSRTETQTPTQTKMPEWFARAPLFPDAPQRNWTATRQTRTAKTIRSFSSVNRGRVLHKILQDIPGMVEHEAMNHARALLAKNQIDVSLAENIVGLIYTPETCDLFGVDSQAEVTLGAVLPNGQRFTGRVDRLIVRDGEIVLIDYKTDRNVPEKLDDNHSYVTQMAAYVLALKQAYNDRQIRVAILWTSIPRLDWIDPESLAKGMAAIT
jgi:ATP-dependent helicase/nuclease subunit A